MWVPWIECCGYRWLDFWVLWKHVQDHAQEGEG